MYVIKIGGGAAIGPEAFGRFAADLAELSADGQRCVVVHGGNAEFNRLSEALGMPPRMVTSASGRISRYTDRATMDAMLMAYRGKVNATLVGIFQAAGVNAVGLCGLDGAIASGRRKAVLRGTEDGRAKVLRDDHSGTIDRVDTRLLTLLIDAGYLPVLTPPILGEGGVPINVDGDKLALALARDLGAEGLLFFSDTPGLLADVCDEGSLVREIDASDPAAALAAASGRMVVKVETAVQAIEGGVRRVIFADGRAEAPIRGALAGEGTVIRAGAATVPVPRLVSREG